MAAVDLRYARALASVAGEQKLNTKDVQDQLQAFSGALQASSDLREVLENPSIPEAQKLHLLDALGQRLGLSKPVRNFIALVSRHRRLGELDAMIAAYAVIADESANVAEVEIVSAFPLSEGSKALLEQQAANLTVGLRVHATYSQDASLLGGAILRIGSTVYDGSVRAQLQQMKQRLMATGA